jgi:tetratricopeptide (TPR) repeat protein
VLGWLTVSGQLAASEGDREQAEAYLQEALSLAQSVEYRHEEARIRLALSEMLGNTEAGQEQLAEALRLFTALGARPEAERVQALVALDYSPNRI